jgi:hypothetical protein
MHCFWCYKYTFYNLFLRNALKFVFDRLFMHSHVYVRRHLLKVFNLEMKVLAQ